jgi:hypothetical protein
MERVERLRVEVSETRAGVLERERRMPPSSGRNDTRSIADLNQEVEALEKTRANAEQTRVPSPTKPLHSLAPSSTAKHVLNWRFIVLNWPLIILK